MASKPATPVTKAEKRELSNNNFFIVLLLISLVAVGAGILITKGLITSIRHNAKVLTATSAANKQLDANVVSAPQLVSSYQSLSGSTPTILTDALPNTPDFPGLISLLETTGNLSGATYTSMVPDVAVGATVAPATSVPASNGSIPTAQSTNVLAKFTGSYPAMMKLINTLQLSARPIQITAIDISGTGAQITGTLSITTYYQAKATLPFGTESIKGTEVVQ
ncbi:hypothetical protein HJC99_01880 [Candidatus Saccharibacteria bacterium]|nr:hypothetical protein [Candidatus Saccharibacteria bacterium]